MAATASVAAPRPRRIKAATWVVSFLVTGFLTPFTYSRVEPALTRAWNALWHDDGRPAGNHHHSRHAAPTATTLPALMVSPTTTPDASSPSVSSGSGRASEFSAGGVSGFGSSLRSIESVESATPAPAASAPVPAPAPTATPGTSDGGTTITNNNTQNVSGGDAVVSGNGYGGDADSGDSTANNTTSNDVTITP